MQNVMSIFWSFWLVAHLGLVQYIPPNFKNYHHSLFEKYSSKNAFKNSNSAVFCQILLFFNNLFVKIDIDIFTHCGCLMIKKKFDLVH